MEEKLFKKKYFKNRNGDRDDLQRNKHFPVDTTIFLILVVMIFTPQEHDNHYLVYNISEKKRIATRKKFVLFVDKFLSEVRA